METFDVIKYLIKEMDLIITKIENYNKRLEGAKEFCKNNNSEMSYNVYKKFNLDENLEKATLKQNAKKIRKLLLKLEGEI